MPIPQLTGPGKPIEAPNSAMQRGHGPKGHFNANVVPSDWPNLLYFRAPSDCQHINDLKATRTWPSYMRPSPLPSRPATQFFRCSCNGEDDIRPVGKQRPELAVRALKSRTLRESPCMPESEVTTRIEATEAPARGPESFQKCKRRS